ncbi:MAG: autotransporter outer membrane beta-barrel domain-containing protein, partial [Alphaproteobacteria bacterium]|nr:autotransporter outer membrane beta-barrel domain-containing protein [Alphaproteobacteria bacterium]
LQMNLGVAAYHEFADPYETELEMQGMSGRFKLRDERRKDNRMVVRGGFDYKYSEEMSLIGTIATFIDGTTHTNANLDFRYHF